jgi:hypothetical protein
MVALLLANFADGLLDRRALLRALEEQHHYRPPRADPNFGSGGHPRGSPWGGRSRTDPFGHRPGGPVGRPPRTGGFGGGGFGTGGGFGGGGFRTGGGF